MSITFVISLILHIQLYGVLWINMLIRNYNYVWFPKYVLNNNVQQTLCSFSFTIPLIKETFCIVFSVHNSLPRGMSNVLLFCLWSSLQSLIVHICHLVCVVLDLFCLFCELCNPLKQDRSTLVQQHSRPNDILQLGPRGCIGLEMCTRKLRRWLEYKRQWRTLYMRMPAYIDSLVYEGNAMLFF